MASVTVVIPLMDMNAIGDKFFTSNAVGICLLRQGTPISNAQVRFRNSVRFGLAALINAGLHLRDCVILL